MASARAGAERRRPNFPGERLKFVGAATGLVLLGGTLGYVFSTSVKLLTW